MGHCLVHKNLIQARYLFEKAQALWEPYREVTNGLVVGLLQDSAEMALWEIVKSAAVPVKDNDPFVAIMQKLVSSGRLVHGQAQMLELNKSRVSYKHYGLCPASSDIPRFVESARFFLKENIKEHLDLDFDTVSLADEVSDAEVRWHLKEAEAFRSMGDLHEALVQASLAFQRVLDVVQEAQFGDFPQLDEAYSLFPPESQESARELILDFGNFWEYFSRSHAMFTLGVDRALFQELEARRFIVNISEGGERLAVHAQQKTAVTPENVNFLISNVIDIARRLPGLLP